MGAILLREHNFETEALNEGEGAAKSWLVKGIFMQAEVVNRNHRVYPKSIMEAQIGNYKKSHVDVKSAYGELTHPKTPEVNIKEASHLIESIVQDGNNFIGCARIMNTPMGNIVKGILEAGGRLGVSSRGLGSVKTNSKGYAEVQPDFLLKTVDIVSNPSAPDAFVEGLMEGTDVVWNTLEEDVAFINSLKTDIRTASSKSLQEAKVKAFASFLSKINS